MRSKTPRFVFKSVDETAPLSSDENTFKPVKQSFKPFGLSNKIIKQKLNTPR